MLSLQKNRDVSPYIVSLALFLWNWRCMLIRIRTKEVTPELLKFLADEKSLMPSNRIIRALLAQLVI